jgi:predicted  nucleic acid-binding Zn-ribbon protein/ribosomal protein L37E
LRLSPLELGASNLLFIVAAVVLLVALVIVVMLTLSRRSSAMSDELARESKAKFKAIVPTTARASRSLLEVPEVKQDAHPVARTEVPASPGLFQIPQVKQQPQSMAPTEVPAERGALQAQEAKQEAHPMARAEGLREATDYSALRKDVLETKFKLEQFIRENTGRMEKLLETGAEIEKLRAEFSSLRERSAVNWQEMEKLKASLSDQAVKLEMQHKNIQDQKAVAGKVVESPELERLRTEVNSLQEHLLATNEELRSLRETSGSSASRKGELETRNRFEQFIAESTRRMEQQSEILPEFERKFSAEFSSLREQLAVDRQELEGLKGSVADHGVKLDMQRRDIDDQKAMLGKVVKPSELERLRVELNSLGERLLSTNQKLQSLSDAGDASALRKDLLETKEKLERFIEENTRRMEEHFGILTELKKLSAEFSSLREQLSANRQEMETLRGSVADQGVKLDIQRRDMDDQKAMLGKVVGPPDLGSLRAEVNGLQERLLATNQELQNLKHAGAFDVGTQAGVDVPEREPRTVASEYVAARFSRACRRCGSPLNAQDNFCEHCGAPVEFPATRAYSARSASRSTRPSPKPRAPR